MSPAFQRFLLAACALIAALDAPRATAVLVQGFNGPRVLPSAGPQAEPRTPEVAEGDRQVRDVRDPELALRAQAPARRPGSEGQGGR